MAYEFYLPLALEAALRVTLDSLFFKDALLPRLARIGLNTLKQILGMGLLQSGDELYESVLSFIDRKFGGYSIYHVDGRFRSAGLCTQDDAASIQKAGLRYLVDETTAVVRFIFPVKDGEPARSGSSLSNSSSAPSLSRSAAKTRSGWWRAGSGTASQSGSRRTARRRDE